MKQLIKYKIARKLSGATNVQLVELLFDHIRQYDIAPVGNVCFHREPNRLLLTHLNREYIIVNDKEILEVINETQRNDWDTYIELINYLYSVIKKYSNEFPLVNVQYYCDFPSKDEWLSNPRKYQYETKLGIRDRGKHGIYLVSGHTQYRWTDKKSFLVNLYIMGAINRKAKLTNIYKLLRKMNTNPTNVRTGSRGKDTSELSYLTIDNISPYGTPLVTILYKISKENGLEPLRISNSLFIEMTSQRKIHIRYKLSTTGMWGCATIITDRDLAKVLKHFYEADRVTYSYLTEYLYNLIINQTREYFDYRLDEIRSKYIDLADYRLNIDKVNALLDRPGLCNLKKLNYGANSIAYRRIRYVWTHVPSFLVVAYLIRVRHSQEVFESFLDALDCSSTIINQTY